MKLPHTLCLVLCLSSLSCDKHTELQREIATLEAACKQDEAAARQYEQDIAAAGGSNALTRLAEQTEMTQARVRPLEFQNAAKERKWSAIESKFAKLKTAADAFKAAHSH